MDVDLRTELPSQGVRDLPDEIDLESVLDRFEDTFQLLPFSSIGANRSAETDGRLASILSGASRHATQTSDEESGIILVALLVQVDTDLTHLSLLVRSTLQGEWDVLRLQFERTHRPVSAGVNRFSLASKMFDAIDESPDGELVLSSTGALIVSCGNLGVLDSEIAKKIGMAFDLCLAHTPLRGKVETLLTLDGEILAPLQDGGGWSGTDATIGVDDQFSRPGEGEDQVARQLQVHDPSVVGFGNPRLRIGMTDPRWVIPKVATAAEFGHQESPPRLLVKLSVDRPEHALAHPSRPLIGLVP
jgi:hypothetical protein